MAHQSSSRWMAFGVVHGLHLCSFFPAVGRNRHVVPTLAVTKCTTSLSNENGEACRAVLDESRRSRSHGTSLLRVQRSTLLGSQPVLIFSSGRDVLIPQINAHFPCEVARSARTPCSYSCDLLRCALLLHLPANCVISSARHQKCSRKSVGTRATPQA